MVKGDKLLEFLRSGSRWIVLLRKLLLRCGEVVPSSIADFACAVRIVGNVAKSGKGAWPIKGAEALPLAAPLFVRFNQLRG
jgi:hypothetical protein